MKMQSEFVWTCLALILVGCQRGPQKSEVPMMQLSGSAITEGAPIPKKYTADGVDVSPALQWQGAPPTTKSFALICDDPDAPRGTWVHWVLFNLPADKTELPEAVPATVGVQGKNDFGKLGYGGPSPPKGKPHRYFFKIYALDALLDLKAGATKPQLEKAMAGHILAQGQLMGTW
jgi:Raf kinase inhibitor-like YbhB/YbcL family protein